jgi:hypothetical protein
MPENESRRQEAVERLQIKGTDQHDVMVVYSEMAQELTGFSSVLASIFDADAQYSLAGCGFPGKSGDRLMDRAQSICSYTLLSNNPTLIPDTSKDERTANHPATIAGMCKSYMGFPIINKDNYVLGSFCLVNSEIKKLSDQKVVLVQKLVARLAHQLDTQSEQREITSNKIQNAIDQFSMVVPNASLDDLKYFISICSGKTVSASLIKNLIKLGLCHSEDKNISLTKKGREIQQNMGIQTQILQKMKIEGNAAENMVNDMLSKLGGL